jgi:uncharacterized membrane protein
MKQKEEMKKGSRQEVIMSPQKQDSSSKLALHALQKTLQVLKMKEYLFLTGFTLGSAFLRVPMQWIPSAEPISFFAMLSGWMFGKKKGFLVGASALFLSNFMVMGGQGPWTLPQMLAFGMIGYLGGFLREKASIVEVMGFALVGTLAFEVIMNIASLAIFPAGIFLLFLTGLPFLAIHVISNLAFVSLLPKAKRWADEKGGFDERELCNSLVSRLRDTSRAKPVRAE